MSDQQCLPLNQVSVRWERSRRLRSVYTHVFFQYNIIIMLSVWDCAGVLLVTGCDAETAAFLK